LNDAAPKELRVRADLAEIGRLRAFLRAGLQGLGVGDEMAMKLELSLHEIFVNIAMYAYPGGKGEMSLRIWSEDGTLHMEFRDTGIPFDPVAREATDIEARVRRGARGGYGIFLFKTLMDGYTYRRDGDENVLDVYKKLSTSGPAQ
jgi:anti-sigma regulatory factor (Ser/Thr protein kinase)